MHSELRLVLLAITSLSIVAANPIFAQTERVNLNSNVRLAYAQSGAVSSPAALPLPIGALFLASENINVKDFGARGDGISDDTVAIKAAIASIAKTKGGSLYFPHGEYLIDQPLLFADLPRITVFGDGKIILKSGSNNVKIMTFYNCSNVLVYGMQIDGNRANQTKITTGDGKDVSENCPGILFEHVTKGTIRNCTLINQQGDGIQVDVLYYDQINVSGRESTDIKIINNSIDTVGRNGISLVHINGAEVYGNKIMNADNFSSTLSVGIDIEPNPTYGYNAKNIRIFDNDISNCKSGGIQVLQASGSIVSNIEVSNNRIYSTGKAVGGGIILLHCLTATNNIVVSDNKIWNTLVGISYDNSNNIKILGNTISEIGYVTPATGFGISSNINYPDVTADNVIIEGNIIENTGNSGIYLTRSNNTLIANNKILGSCASISSEKCAIRLLFATANARIVGNTTDGNSIMPIAITTMGETMRNIYAGENVFLGSSYIWDESGGALMVGQNK